MSIHEVGEKFDLNKLKKAQQLTKDVVNKVAERAFVGMTEADGIKIIEEEFLKIDKIKFWHPHKFRIGKNTLCSFKDQSDDNVKLEMNDHFFIDVGPILFDHEGDFGDTFILGKNPLASKLKENTHQLFSAATKKFLEENLSGQKLYSFLEIEAKNLNCHLNMKTLGHRIGDFPHHLYYRGKMGDIDQRLLPNLWVLEIQVSDSQNSIGAFFEDILWN